MARAAWSLSARYTTVGKIRQWAKCPFAALIRSANSCSSANIAAAVAEQEAPAEAELDEMDHDEFAAQELVLPEAPGNPSDDSDDEGCTTALAPWTDPELSSSSGNCLASSRCCCCTKIACTSTAEQVPTFGLPSLTGSTMR